MKFTLKGYQDIAVRDVLDRLRKARRRWHEDGDKHAFSLTAATGAGKTVMAAAVFEALFHGDDEREFDADPGAVVIWFSDDPSLNEQTRFRLIEAADRIDPTDLVVVGNTFQREKLQPGKIYFLNTQKLGKKSLLVRGHDPEGEFPAIRPDLRSYTIWDMIANTIEDLNLTLYLVLDEAHRGMGNGAADGEKSTIVKRLINGAGLVPAIPVVWGISATVERFNKAMEGAQGRGTLPNVEVDPTLVQDSGLLKDTIVLDVPNEKGDFDTVLVRRATDKIKESTSAWAAYAKQEGDEAVLPLMVLQVPDKPDPKDVAGAIDTILDRWPDLPAGSIAHVLGEHTTQTFEQHEVPYISPERVQESHWVRVLIAKTAISTGWDCPRAEVMVSFRAAKDKTHITQLLGRMVRTPLARRIPGNDHLNSVDCLLPMFDRETVEAVVDMLMSGGSEGAGEGGMPARRVLINPTEMTPNPDVPEKVWDKFLALPAQSLPQRTAKPIKRLTALAHELAADKLLPDAGKKAHAKMHKALDAARVQYSEEIAAQRKAVLTVEGLTLKADLQGMEKSFDQFLEDADYAVIEDAYRRAAREVSPDVARTYVDHLTKEADEDEMDEALIDARADVAALGLVPQVKAYLDVEADKLAQSWFNEHRVAIKSLSDERQEEYRQIKGMSAEPQDIDLAKPKSRLEPTIVREANGSDTAIPTYAHHLLCDADGNYPSELNSWEAGVLAKETQRDGFVAWYRNPSRASQDSLGIAYQEGGGQYRIVRPDFIFFAIKSDGSIVADIVDPHGVQLSDALPKLKGLAAYTETHRGDYRRVESVAKVGDSLRVLDLTDPEVRKAIIAAQSARELYESVVADSY